MLSLITCVYPNVKVEAAEGGIAHAQWKKVFAGNETGFLSAENTPPN